MGVSATLRPLYPREWPGTHCIGDWMGPRPVRAGAENLAPTGIRSRTVQPVASRYTDWAVQECHIKIKNTKIKLWNTNYVNIIQHHYAKEADDVVVTAEGNCWLRSPTERWSSLVLGLGTGLCTSRKNRGQISTRVYMVPNPCIVYIYIYIYIYIYMCVCVCVCAGQLSRYSDWLRAGRSGIESRWGRDLSARPDRPWGPPRLLWNGYRVFPGGKVRPGRAADHSPPSSAAVMEE